ncbi:phage tail protein [Nitrobacter sp.]|uniref:phage tail protein n=1 Tax=Nitrobacter sp. TaxID=29420 RepID=UPI001D88F0CF|nr:phage tail protein [Nitrobacter sp.]MCB1393244.1 phage tail protein [Nitrobacter sp.]
MAILGLGAAIAGAGTFLAGAINLGVSLAVSVGLSYAAQALAGKPKTPAQEEARFSTSGQLQASGAAPRSFVIGKGCPSGLLVYANTWGTSDDGKSPNAYFTQVIKLSDLPIKALTGVWIGGEKCTLGALDSEKGYAITEYFKDGKDHVWVKFYDGTQTTADSFLTSKVSTSDRPYTSTRVGAGCAYVIATALVDDTLYTGLPQFKFEVSGIKLYDPTKDSTNGGAGSHRFSDPSTWGGDGDDLPAVQAYNLLRGIRYNGAWLYGLQKTTQANLPSVNWNTQIAKCRATISGVGGVESTYRSGGQVAVNIQPADTLDALMTACHGKISEVGGFYKVHLGAPDSPSFSFTDGDILSTEEQTFNPFFQLADSVNGITGTYPDPDQSWNMVSAPALYNSTYEAIDGSRRLLANPSFDLVPYAEQVQRLMRSALLAARRERTHQLVMPPAFWLVEPGDIGSWTSARNGYVAKLFEATAVTDRANLDVGLSLQEVDPGDYDWNHDTDYTAPTSGPTAFPRPAPQGVLAWAAVGYTLLDKDGYTRRPAIQLSWDGDVPGCVGVQYELAHQNPVTDEWIVLSRNRTDQISAGALIIWSGLIANEPYRVRGQYIPAAPRDMLWSDWIDVTTPDARLSILDFVDAIKAQITTLQEKIADQSREIEALISSIAANQDARNWLDKTSVRTQMTAQAGTLSASITNVQTVAADATAAVAADVTNLFAGLDGNSGQINVTAQAVADLTNGIGLSYGVELDVNGYAIGFQLLNGGPSTGTTIFTTGTFSIVGTGASPVQPFIVDTNSSTVVLDADNILLNGSVKATKMDVAELSAITADLGDVTAGTLSSPNGKWAQDLNNGTLIISD